MKITLKYIRDCKTFEELKPAIVFVCDNMNDMTWGEFTAFQRMIEIQCQKVGKTLKDLNEYAIGYQDRGEK